MFWFLKNSPAKSPRYTAPASFTISRRTWARGGRNGASRLLNDDGNRCCMGFYASACRIPDTILLDNPGPICVMKDHGVAVPKLYPLPEGLVVSRMMGVNDDKVISEADREIKVTELFAEIGVKVEFVE